METIITFNFFPVENLRQLFQLYTFVLPGRKGFLKHYLRHSGFRSQRGRG